MSRLRQTTVFVLVISTLAFSTAARSPLPVPLSVTFPSLDGLDISADLYLTSDDRATPFIVLFHEAGSSRGEYRDIAPRLNALGYNVMAVDQRAGGGANDVKNETFTRAVAVGLPTDFLDAQQDLEAALRYARATYAAGPLIAWGSSYSAGLVLRLAGSAPGLVNGVMAFSPGEYFPIRSVTYVQDTAVDITIPTFITSASYERPDWQAIFSAVPTPDKTGFVPEEGFGQHVSSTLVSSQPEREAYWRAVETFLGTHFPDD